MEKWFLIAVGGAFGSVCRYGLSGLVSRTANSTFPWGTITVNILGCLLMGVLFRGFVHFSALREEYRVAILVGVLGGFTTFSSFGIDAFRLFNDGQWRHAAGYIVLTNVGCLVAVWIGYRVMEKVQ